MSIKSKRENLTLKQKRIISIIIFALLMLFCAYVGWVIGRPMIRFVENPEKFRAWVDDKGFIGKIAFVFMTVFQVIIAFVPGEPLEIGAGYAFGIIEGTLLCMIGITLGSIITFALVRKLGMRFVEIFFSRDKIKSLKFLQNEKKLGLIIFLIFFIPGTPKDLVTYFVGLTPIKPERYLLLVSVARLPSIITSTVGGEALVGKDYVSAIIVFAVTAVLSAVGLLIYNLYTKQKARSKKEH